ncbi:hypothetical protein G4V62_02985 [Bacillaceae bacterium SIJ1]|nr:sigma factor-like helix-turn-helix DNA-binding protein [Litoribacterium kuwaitense]NGP43963.1 hypothetical protein [Litoribacterium kuwaitense]
MKYYQQMTIEEISTVLQRNQNTIKSRLKRAIAMLKKQIGGSVIE